MYISDKIRKCLTNQLMFKHFFYLISQIQRNLKGKGDQELLEYPVH